MNIPAMMIDRTQVYYLVVYRLSGDVVCTYFTRLEAERAAYRLGEAVRVERHVYSYRDDEWKIQPIDC